jgi:hypothetical protein
VVLQQCNMYENKMAKHGLLKVISCPTREEFSKDKLSSSCIDHIFTRNLDNILGSVIKSKITDHYIITIDISVNLYREHAVNSHLDNVMYNRELKSVRWHKIKAKKDPNEICNTIIDVFNHIKNYVLLKSPDLVMFAKLKLINLGLLLKLSNV